MEDYRTASKLITPNCYMASIDLKDAYFLINITESQRKYLRFKYRSHPNCHESIYEFTCLPFGLCTAPYVFTKLLKPVMEYLRNKDLMSVIYLDDILCFGQSFEECNFNVNYTMNLLKYLGFIINKEKSSLTPKQECKFLGFIYDSKNMLLKLPNDKKIKIRKCLDTFLHKRKCKLRDFARLIGLLISACPAVQYSWLYTKMFERHKYLCLLENPSYEQYIDLPSNLINDFYWWLNHINNANSPLRFNQFDYEIFSDASLSGWGAFCNNTEASGHWKQNESCLHINELELKAAFLALKVFAKDLCYVDILLRIDNTTAICCINRMGSVQYPHLNKITREIWQWCETRNIYVFASYINSKENKEADTLSRKSFQDTEWELADYAFEKLTRTFGNFEVDLFASRCNAKCETYVTWKIDPDAWAVDAFTVSWKNLNFYAFPPFILILKVLRKIITDQSEGVVVVPYWPSQPWFPLFKKLVCSSCIYFEPDINLLTSPFRVPHNLHRTLGLLAAKLSGKNI